MWAGYWAATDEPGGRRAAAIVRMAIAASVLWTLWKLGTSSLAGDVEHAPRELYRRLGLWMLGGGGVPSPATLRVLFVVAGAATGCMLVGLWTRATMAISLVSGLLIASFAVSFSPTWSHQYNVPFLAQIAFLGARGGDVWSVDAWWRRRRGLPEVEVPGAYQWSLRLCQLAVALMFLSACVFKIGAGGGTLAWALSDNLRHQLLSRFDLIGVPRTAAADWLLGAPWRWHTAAMLNLISQAMPIGAVFAVRRPWLRAMCGSFFVIETLALGVVMDLWNLHWLPLAAVFVDWERVLGRRTTGVAAGLRRGTRVWIAVFVAYDVVVSFAYPRIDQKLRTYPFSAFPMFAKVLAKRPYDRHQSYEIPGGRIEVQGVGSAALQTWVDQSYVYRTMWKLRGRDEVARRMGALLAEVRQRPDGAGVTGLRLKYAWFRAPAVPAPAGLEYLPLATIAEIDASGVRTLLGQAGKDARGPYVEGGVARLVYFAAGDPRPRPLAAERVGSRWYYQAPREEDAVVAAVLDSGETFLVGP
jgi:hypothetical protein